jgi:hypothetical protein
MSVSCRSPSRPVRRCRCPISLGPPVPAESAPRGLPALVVVIRDPISGAKQVRSGAWRIAPLRGLLGGLGRALGLLAGHPGGLDEVVGLVSSVEVMCRYGNGEDGEWVVGLSGGGGRTRVGCSGIQWDLYCFWNERELPGIERLNGKCFECPEGILHNVCSVSEFERLLFSNGTIDTTLSVLRLGSSVTESRVSIQYFCTRARSKMFL